MISRRQSLKAVIAGAAVNSVAPASAVAVPVRLIVLDVGGTIIEDRGDVPEALKGAFARAGITVDDNEIAHWRGASKREIVRHFVSVRAVSGGNNASKLADSIYADFTRQVLKAYQGVPAIRGAEQAFEQLRQSGYLLAASTGFGKEIASSIFRRLGWDKYFVAVVTSDDVAQGRPAPFMIFHAMEAARVDNVAQVITVGDTPFDLRAGRNGGVRGIVGVLSGASKQDRLLPEPHTDIIGSVAGLPELIRTRY